MMPRGYDRALYILPFDDRGSFQKTMFGWNSPLRGNMTLLRRTYSCSSE